MGAFTQDFIVQSGGKKKHKTGAMDVPARLWNPDGTPFAGGSAYTLPAATPAALGGVKKGAAVAAVSAADVTAAAGNTPTKAEFDAMVAELNETKKQLNAALGSLKAAGVIG